MESIFESGNERTEVFFTSASSGLKTGYHIRSTDMFILNSELMNMNNSEKWVWITLTYDYVEKFQEYKESKVLWVSVGASRCGYTIQNPFGVTNLTKTLQPTKNIFSEHSIPWTAEFDGHLIATNGHMHDGGTSIEMYKNDEVICVSLPQYVSGGNSAMRMINGLEKRQMGHDNSGNKNAEHIATQSPCIFDRPVPLKKGDKIHIKANYNFTSHAG